MLAPEIMPLTSAVNVSSVIKAIRVSILFPADGLMERFNETVKAMISESIPNNIMGSVGFSPFDYYIRES